ncbi:hypothetical protein C8R44DRAFT_738698 [Mycena epipterygia]|nr:hypothetical protein C8R44DRAFT_738698 [Mycena epipterygia]
MESLYATEQDASDAPDRAARETLPGKNHGPRSKCRARTPLFLPEPADADGHSEASPDDTRPRKRRRTDMAFGVRRFLDLEADESNESPEGDDEDALEEAHEDKGFIDNTPVRVASGSPRPHIAARGLEDRAREADQLAAQARRFELRAQEERHAAVGCGAPVQSLEQHMLQLLQPPSPSRTFPHRWARLHRAHGAAQVGQLVLVESPTSVVVVVAKESPHHDNGRDSPLVTDPVGFGRLSVKSGKALDEALSWETGPTQHDIELWDRADTGLLRAVTDPMAGTACVPGCRVAVDSRDPEHSGKSGFLVGRMNSAFARIRLSFNGRRIHLSSPNIYQLLHERALREDDEIEVQLPHTRRHLLSFRSPLQILDRVVVLGSALDNPRGRVSEIDTSAPAPTVTIVASDDSMLQVPLSSVARDFALGDLVKVISGREAGATGIVVNLTHTDLHCDQGLPLGLEIFSVNKRADSEGSGKVKRWEQVMKLLFSGMEGEDDMMAGLDTTSAGYDLLQVLCEQVEFTEPEARAGGWTVPTMPEPLYRTRQMVKADGLKEEGMRAGRRYRNKPILIVRPHAMKGRRGVIEDYHEVLVRGTSERRLVFTVRIDNSVKTCQVPEKHAVHLWTGLPLRQAQHVAPWAGVMKWNWSDQVVADSLCVDGMRTPLQSSSADPDPDPAWVVPSEQSPVPRPPPPPRIGKDGGRWLCIPKLQGKRVDVVVLQKTAGRVTPRQANAEGQSGFIELDQAMTEDRLNTTIIVRLGDWGKRVRLEPRWLAPMRTMRCPPTCMPDVSITAWKGRVVVIGPDSIGNTEHMGEYGWTMPMGNPDMTWVKFARDHRDGPPLEGYYHVQSLCRAHNSAGVNTKPTTSKRIAPVPIWQVVEGGQEGRGGRLDSARRRAVKDTALSYNDRRRPQKQALGYKPQNGSRCRVYSAVLMPALSLVKVEARIAANSGGGPRKYVENKVRMISKVLSIFLLTSTYEMWVRATMMVVTELTRSRSETPETTQQRPQEDGTQSVERTGRPLLPLDLLGEIVQWLPEGLWTSSTVCQLWRAHWSSPAHARRVVVDDRWPVGPRQMDFMVDTLAAAPDHPTTELQLDWSRGRGNMRQMEQIMLMALSRPETWTSLTIVEYATADGFDDARAILRSQLPLMHRLRSLVIEGHSDKAGFYVHSPGPPISVATLESAFVSFTQIDQPELEFSLDWSKIHRYEEHWTRLHSWNLPATHLRQMVQLTHLVLVGACMPDGPVTFDVLLILELDLRKHAHRGPAEKGVDPLQNIRAPALQRLSVRAGVSGGLDMGRYIVNYLRRTPHTHLAALAINNTTGDVMMQLWAECPGLRLELAQQPPDCSILPVGLLRVLGSRRVAGQLVVHMGSTRMDNLELWLEALERVLANESLRIRIERHWWGRPPFALAQWGVKYSDILRQYADIIEHKDHVP